MGTDVFHYLLHVALGQRPAGDTNQTNVVQHARLPGPASTRQLTAGDGGPWTWCCDARLEAEAEAQRRGDTESRAPAREGAHASCRPGAHSLPKRMLSAGVGPPGQLSPAQVTSGRSRPQRGRQEGLQPAPGRPPARSGDPVPGHGAGVPLQPPPLLSLLPGFPAPHCPRWPGSPGPRPAAHLLVPSMEPPRPSQPATSCQLTSCTCRGGGHAASGGQPGGTHLFFLR